MLYDIFVYANKQGDTESEKGRRGLGKRVSFHVFHLIFICLTTAFVCLCCVNSTLFFATVPTEIDNFYENLIWHFTY